MDYKDILNKTWGEVQENKTLPIGSYVLKLRNAVIQEPKGNANSPSAMFVYQPKEAMSDVDEAEFAELGADYDISENRVYFRMWLEDGRDIDNVRNHLARHGIETPDDETLEETFKKVGGQEIIAYLTHRAYERKDGSAGLDNEPSDWRSLDE